MADHNSYYDHVSQLVNKWIRTGRLSEEEGKDEVMLEGFMDSVRALTEIDTESFVKNSSLQSLLKNEEMVQTANFGATSEETTDLGNSKENNSSDDNQIALPVETSSGSFF